MLITKKKKIIVVSIAVVVVAILVIYKFSQKGPVILSADEQVISQGTVGGNEDIRIGVMWAYNGEAQLGLYDEIKRVELPSKTVKKGEVIQVGDYQVEITNVGWSSVTVKIPRPVDAQGYQLLTHEYISENTQAEVEKLWIGAGNIWESEYIDIKGESKKGITARLWLFYKDRESLDRTEKIYPGKDFEIGYYKIIVTGIKEGTEKFTPPGGSNGFVSLDIFKKK